MRKIGSYEIILKTTTFNEAIDVGMYMRVGLGLNLGWFPRISHLIPSKRTIQIFSFREEIFGSIKIIREMKDKGFKPGIIWELLALGAQHPDLQRNICVVALGDVSCNDQVPLIRSEYGQRVLTLTPFNKGWNRDYKFAFTREE